MALDIRIIGSKLEYRDSTNTVHSLEGEFINNEGVLPRSIIINTTLNQIEYVDESGNIRRLDRQSVTTTTIGTPRSLYISGSDLLFVAEDGSPYTVYRVIEPVLEPAQWSVPSMANLFFGSSNFDAAVIGGDADGQWPDSYEVQSKSGGSTWTTLTNTANSGWGTSGTKTGTWTLTGIEDNPIKVRIRASAQGGTSASAWSGEFTVMKKPTNLGLTQPDSESAQVTATWSHPTGYNTFSMRLEWYKNDVFDAATFPSAGATSASRTYADTDVIKVRIKYDEGEYTAFSPSVTIDIVLNATMPSNLQLTETTVSWTHATTRDRYRVEAKDATSGTWTLVGTTTNNSISWVPCDYKATSGFVSIEVRVRAEMTGGGTNSAWLGPESIGVSCF